MLYKHLKLLNLKNRVISHLYRYQSLYFSPCIPDYLMGSSEECQQAFNNLCQFNSIVWVPGHSKIDGDEYGGKVARLGSRSRLPGPEHHIPTFLTLHAIQPLNNTQESVSYPNHPTDGVIICLAQKGVRSVEWSAKSLATAILTNYTVDFSDVPEFGLIILNRFLVEAND